ncbi:MAG TPA: methyltransferase domain-containing protein [Solirubrobacteraceae bacterium]|nr:methyltransferase domain-containing protein [Solirubrobacteraceae bacterium]
MSLWGRVFAAGYDRFTAGAERAGLAQRRHALLEPLRGRVIEIGGGTGANLEHYPPGLEELIITEPEPPMARRLKQRVHASALPARVVQAPAEHLPFPDNSFDFAVSTLVLCTVDDPVQALSELHRVLRPGGELVFIEHVRASSPRLARWQDRLHPLWVRFGHGCHCNRATVENIRAAGFDVRRIEHGALAKAPAIVRPLVVGSAAVAA